MNSMEPQTLLGWQRACTRAAKSRGLGFELLTRSLPGSLVDGVLLVRCPEPALLGVEPARLAARSFLRTEFSDPCLDIELLPPNGDEDWSLSFQSRTACAAEAERMNALAAFGSEELTARVLALGGQIVIPTFRSWP